MPADDLTRADAEAAISVARRALDALQHVAIAGVLHDVGNDLGPAGDQVLAIVMAHETVLRVMCEAARRLPE